MKIALESGSMYVLYISYVCTRIIIVGHGRMKSSTDILTNAFEKLTNNSVSKFALEGGDGSVQIKDMNEMQKNDGVMIVLTASEIEMSDFNLNPLNAFSAGFPKFLVQKKGYPPLPSNSGGTAKFAPYGLRKVESLLIEDFGGKTWLLYIQVVSTVLSDLRQESLAFLQWIR